MKMQLAFVSASLAIVTATTVRAEDPQKDAITVLPSTQSTVIISNAEKKGKIAFAYQGSSWQLSLGASAPLDEDTRVASFLRQNDLVGGFNFNGYIGYDGAAKALDLNKRQLELIPSYGEICADIQQVTAKAPRCVPNEVNQWLKENPEEAKKLKSIQKYAPICAEIKRVFSEEFPCNPAKITEWSALNPKKWSKVKASLEGHFSNIRFMPDLGMLTSQRGTYVALGVEWSVSYDQTSAYERDDLTKPAAKPFTKYNIQIGGRQTVYINSMVAMTLRAGLSASRGFEVEEFKRCKALPTTNAELTASQCTDKAFILTDIDESAKITGHFRWAVTYVPLKPIGIDMFPGLELRASLENLGQRDATLQLRGIAFVTPALGILAARFGVGIDVSNRLSKPSNPDIPSTTFTPLVIVGAAPE